MELKNIHNDPPLTPLQKIGLGLLFICGIIPWFIKGYYLTATAMSLVGLHLFLPLILKK